MDKDVVKSWMFSIWWLLNWEAYDLAETHQAWEA